MISKKYPYIHEIDTRQLVDEIDLNTEGFIIPSVKQFKSIIRHESYAPNNDILYIFPRHDESTQNGSQIFIHIFKFPKTEDKYLKELSFYSNQKKPFKLSQNEIFDEDKLCFKQLSDRGLEHLAFQTKDGKFRKRIIHSYKSEFLGLLSIYSLDNNDFDGNSFFKLFSEKCYLEK